MRVRLGLQIAASVQLESINCPPGALMYTDLAVDESIFVPPQVEESMTKPLYLLPEHLSRTDGTGPALDLGAKTGKLLVVTLGINHVVEHGGLIVSIWGSEDGENWGLKPLVSFPQKYYCGFYSVLLNLAKNPSIRYLRPQWTMKAWAKRQALPLFSFHLFAEESGARLTTAVA